MARAPRSTLLTGVVLVAGLLAAPPAGAFSLFGIHLWGDREQPDEFEIIDPLPFTVTLQVKTDADALERPLEQASSLWGDRDTPASGVGGLLSKARGDYRRLLAALYDRGYYGPYISIQAAGREVADLTLAAQFPPEVPIVILVDPGPRFEFGAVRIVNEPAWGEDDVADGQTPAEVGFRTGQPARAAVIEQASRLSIERWRQMAHAKAKETDRLVIADHRTSQLDATLTIEPGRAARYGSTTVTGSKRTDPDFIAFMAALPEGARFDPDEVQTGQDRLNRLGIFRSLRIEEAPEILPDGTLPMYVRVEDRRPRSFGVGGTVSTIDGIGVSAYWQHRNLLGRAEQLRYYINIDGLGATYDPQDYDYTIGASFTKPGVYTPDTNFVSVLEAVKADYDTYREESVTGSVGLTQLFGSKLTGSVLAQVSKARYEDGFGTREFLTFGLVTSAAYDRRDNPLDAHRGYYLDAQVQPFYEAEYGNSAVRGTLEGRVYHSMLADERLTLAGRLLLGSYLGPSTAESPPNLLFFAGGGGSVRGYEFQSIGVDSLREIDGETFVVGGRGLANASAELRYRFGDSNWGAVGFVDSALVTQGAALSGDDDLRTGAGLGVRYYTPIGVMRVDVARALNPRPQDPSVAVYIGIGQAF